MGPLEDTNPFITASKNCFVIAFVSHVQFPPVPLWGGAPNGLAIGLYHFFLDIALL